MSENFSINQQQTDGITQAGQMSFQIREGRNHVFCVGEAGRVCWSILDRGYFRIREGEQCLQNRAAEQCVTLMQNQLGKAHRTQWMLNEYLLAIFPQSMTLIFKKKKNTNHSSYFCDLVKFDLERNIYFSNFSFLWLWRRGR